MQHMKKEIDIVGILAMILSIIWAIIVIIIWKPIVLISTFLGGLLIDVVRGVYGKIVQALTVITFGALIGFVGYLGSLLK